MKFRLIGPGSAGLSLKIALEKAGWTCAGIIGRDDDPVDAASAVDFVLIAVPDRAISQVARSLKPNPKAVIIHISGATPLSAIEQHSRRASMHPLISLPNPERGAWKIGQGGVTFAISDSGDAIASIIVGALKGRAITIPEDKRALYHAAASISANHSVVLCAQVERLCSTMEISPEPYWEMMMATIENVRIFGAVPSLTGPASRGDRETIAKHLAALKPTERTLYRTLASEAASLVGLKIEDEGNGIDGVDE